MSGGRGRGYSNPVRFLLAALCAGLFAGVAPAASLAATITVGSELTGTVSADNGCEGIPARDARERQRRRPELTRRRRGRAVARGRSGDRAAATRAAGRRRRLARRAGQRVRGASHRTPARRVGDAIADRRWRLLGVDAGVRAASSWPRGATARPPLPGHGDHAFWLPLLEDGQVRPPFATTGLEALVNVDIESDADRDGFGDDTQDCAPADPAVHDTCGATPAPAPSSPASPAPPPGPRRSRPRRAPPRRARHRRRSATPGAPVSPPATAPRRTAARCRVPNLRGRTPAAARRALRARNCRLGAVTRVRARGVARGRVLSHRPRAGRVLPAGTRVHVRIRG